MDRRKNMCFYIVPLYIGERAACTRGKPNESKDYIFQCFIAYDIQTEVYHQADTIEELCNECKKYFYVKPLSKEEIKQRYGSREVMVVTKSGWYYKTI